VWHNAYRLGPQECIEVAVALGARTLNVAHFRGGPTEPAAMAERLYEVGELAAEAGVRLSLEFIPGTGFPDYAGTLDIVQRTGRDNIGVPVRYLAFCTHRGHCRTAATIGGREHIRSPVQRSKGTWAGRNLRAHDRSSTTGRG
jgi:hydroxypyruvate isomerase